MKKFIYLIVLALILGLALTGCLLSNVGQVPTTEQSGIAYLTKSVPPLPPPNNLVGLWRFDGNADDSSGNGNDGTVSGATYVDSPMPMGQALSFDGVDDYVDCGNDASLDITTAITIETWVFPRSAGLNNYGRIMDMHLAPCLLVGPNGQLRWFGDIGGTSVDKAVCTGCVSWNSWHHLALTYDMNEAIPTIRGYVDGELKGTITGYSGPLSTTSVRLAIGNSLEEGTAYYLSRAFDGLIDEVRIWNVALLPDQLGIIYDFGGFLPPVSLGKPFKMGSTIPIKFQLTDVQGVFVTNASPSISRELISGGTPSGEVIDGNSSGAANTDSTFRYDPDSNQYIFNLATKDLTAPATYRITVALGDGTTQQVNIGLK